MIRPPPLSTHTDTLFPYTTLFRSINQKATSPSNSATQFGFPQSNAFRTCDLSPVTSRKCQYETRGIEPPAHLSRIEVELRASCSVAPLEDRKSTRPNSSH